MKHDATTGGSHRLEAFSDAVFAFACTLLVVSLEVPRDFAELVADLKGFVAFGFAFTILILIWMAHYRLFRHFPLDDSWSVLLNSCLLFVVLLFVYPLKFLAVSFVKSLFGISGGPIAALPDHDGRRAGVGGRGPVWLGAALGPAWMDLHADRPGRLGQRGAQRRGGSQRAPVTVVFAFSSGCH